MECPTVINKIVFTSPEAMVEFSGEKNRISALVKNPFKCKFIFVWKVNEKASFSLITNHTKTLCEECETKSFTIQALGQLWITQSVMFPGNVYSPNVVAKYYVMFLWAQELKERGFKCFELLVSLSRFLTWFLVLKIEIYLQVICSPFLSLCLWCNWDEGEWIVLTKNIESFIPLS